MRGARVRWSCLMMGSNIARCRATSTSCSSIPRVLDSRAMCFHMDGCVSRQKILRAPISSCSPKSRWVMERLTAHTPRPLQPQSWCVAHAARCLTHVAHITGAHLMFIKTVSRAANQCNGSHHSESQSVVVWEIPSSLKQACAPLREPSCAHGRCLIIGHSLRRHWNRCCNFRAKHKRA